MNELQPIKQYNQRVLTTGQLAESFGTDPKIINRNFQRNAERYAQGKHFFALTGEELKHFKGSRQIDDHLKFASVLYLWTEKGAWLHAKSLNTDQAWDAYEKLVDEYYKLAEEKKLMSPAELALFQAQNLVQLEQKVIEHDSKILSIEEKVDNQITLDHGEQRRLQKLVGIKVFEHAKSDEHKKLLFPELYREIKDRFGVASYRDLKRQDLQTAIRYVESWIPKKTN